MGRMFVKGMSWLGMYFRYEALKALAGFTLTAY